MDLFFSLASEAGLLAVLCMVTKRTKWDVSGFLRRTRYRWFILVYVGTFVIRLLVRVAGSPA